MADSNPNEHKLFKSFVIILLLFITFFLGSMWFKMVAYCSYDGGKMMCPFGKKGGPKMCPITGKPLEAPAAPAVQ